MPANGSSLTSSTAGRSSAIASVPPIARGSLEAGADDVGVGDHLVVQRQLVGHRPAQPLVAGGRRDVAGHRPASLGHDVGERGVANVEVPQRRARS